MDPKSELIQSWERSNIDGLNIGRSSNIEPVLLNSGICWCEIFKPKMFLKKLADLNALTFQILRNQLQETD